MLFGILLISFVIIYTLNKIGGPGGNRTRVCSISGHCFIHKLGRLFSEVDFLSDFDLNSHQSATYLLSLDPDAALVHYQAAHVRRPGQPQAAINAS